MILYHVGKPCEKCVAEGHPRPFRCSICKMTYRSYTGAFICCERKKDKLTSYGTPVEEVRS